MNSNKKIFFFVFFTTLILAYFQTARIDALNYELKLKRHTEIISNTAEYPYKYRLLNPYISNVYFTVLKSAMSEKPAFLTAYFFQNLIVYGFLIFSVLRLFRLWFDDTGSIIGALLFALIIPLSLTGYDTLGDMTTAAIMATAFYFINTNKEKLLFPLMIISAFNELQLILIVAFYFFSKKGNLSDKKVWINSILLTALFLAAYYVIYLIRGGYASGDDYKWYFTKDAAFNVGHKDWILLWVILITPFIPFVFKGFANKAEFLKRNVVTVLPVFYFFAFFFIARLREIDKALTIFLILIPMALFTLIPKHIRSGGNKD